MVFFKYCSCSINPAQMASAMKLGVQAGRLVAWDEWRKVLPAQVH
jgi:thiazole synthase ThiGH ThiG subunit